MKWLPFIWLMVSASVMAGQEEADNYRLNDIIYLEDPTYDQDVNGVELVLPQFNIKAYNSSFTLEEVVTSSEGVNLVSLEQVQDQWRDENMLLLQAQLNTFSLRWHNDDYSIGIGHNARWIGSLQFTDDFASIATYGNASLIEQPSMIGPDQNYLYYDEYYLSTVLKLDRWKIGVKLKFLSGNEFLETPRSEIIVNTRDGGYSIELDNDYRIDTYQVMEYQGLDEVDIYIDPWSMSLPFGKNKGLGFDIGVRGMITDRIQVNASVTDIGSITWDNSTSYSSNEVLGYEGIDLLDYLSEDGNVDIADSLYNLLDLKEQANEGLSTGIPMTMNVGIAAGISDSHTIGGRITSLSHNQLKLNQMDLYWIYDLGKGFQSRINYSIIGRSFNNFGLGIHKRSGLFRWYFSVDNAVALVRPLDVRYGSLSFGSSLFFN